MIYYLIVVFGVPSVKYVIRISVVCTSHKLKLNIVNSKCCYIYTWYMLLNKTERDLHFVFMVCEIIYKAAYSMH